jgi:hypothetical protein
MNEPTSQFVLARFKRAIQYSAAKWQWQSRAPAQHRDYWVARSSRAMTPQYLC